MTATVISESSRLRLLRMAVGQRTTEVAGLVLPALILSLYGWSAMPRALLVWAGVHVALSLALYLQKRAFLSDEKRLNAHDMLVKWEVRFKLAAATLGLAWGAPAWLIAVAPPPEVVTAVLLVAAGTTVSALTYVAPALFSAFVLFFVVCWVPVLFAMHRLIPDHWLTLFVLYAFHSAAVFRHAKTTKGFFIEQARLEEEAARLAEQYRAAKDEAERTVAAMNRFLVMASHDLRQPVHSMGMLVETIRVKNHDPSVSGLLSDLKSCTSAVNLMFNSLLDLSRMDAGITVPKPMLVELNQLLLEVQTIFAPDAARRSLSLRLRLSRGRALVNADPGLLRRAIYNLTHNALRYTTHGGVLLAIRRKRGDWRIEVWDTGIGMTAYARDTVFSSAPYYRRQHAWGIDSEGHGLGLAVVARCAAAMDVQLGLASRLGRGTLFWLALPWVSPSQHLLMAMDTPQVPGAVMQPLRGHCLVVEDDPQVSAAWLALLQAWQIDVRLASSAREAFDVLESGFVPDVIFCDQRLRSGESGFEVFCDLLARCPDARGAIASGDLASSDLARAEEEGYVVLQKPLEPTALHALLARWLQADAASADVVPDQAAAAQL